MKPEFDNIRELKVRLLEHAFAAPFYATEGSGGLDLYSTIDYLIPGLSGIRLPAGVCVEIPPGFEGQIRPRSSLSVQDLLGHFGTIDSDYRGELLVRLFNLNGKPYQVRRGDRIAQLVIAPVERVSVRVVDRLSETGRGAGGFGSTGR